MSMDCMDACTGTCHTDHADANSFHNKKGSHEGDPFLLLPIARREASNLSI